MTQAQVIITKTHVYVTGYSPYGATIIFEEVHGQDSAEEVYELGLGSDVLLRANALAYLHRNRPIVREDATQGDVLDGKFNNLFI
jgi:hypothetical protein